MKKSTLLATFVAVVAGTFTAAVVASPASDDIASLESLAALEALPESAVGTLPAMRDTFAKFNDLALGYVPMRATLRLENTIARSVMAIDGAPNDSSVAAR